MTDPSSTPEQRRFALVDETVIHEGRVLTLVEDTFRFEDGAEAKREIVRTTGAVGMLVHDGTHLLLTRQPREAIGDPDSLEIPAGRLDKDGEAPLDTAKRELAEEVGFAAAHWQPIVRFQPSVGILSETVHLFCGWELSAETADSGEDERIELVRWPVDDLDGAIAAVSDAKTLIALLWAKANGLPGV
ncbi:NUDIX hydrolase [Patulibacter sp. SYSU D01012]|uniref:NUDIX hydrolase n=1 Tax=Patulibacter sp. SYSU D01012 TaxID=2817381 RepID=UPI001B3115F6|nr:NUDIX hydrolase [Patulibacter sp. SYSU D01012]